MTAEIINKACQAASTLITNEMKTCTLLADDAARRYVSTDDQAAKADWAKYTYTREALDRVQRNLQRAIAEATQ